MTFKTTEVYVSGAICGHMWMPDSMGGYPHRQSLIGYGGFDMQPGMSFRDVLLGILTAKGGDFQDARFAADTEVVIIRKSIDGPGKYRLHTRTRTLDQLPDCGDLLHADTYVGDFYGDDN